MSNKGDALPFSRERSLLLITDRAPWPADSGDRQRTALLLAAMNRVAPTDLLLVQDPQNLAPLGPETSETLVEQTLREKYGLVECVGPAARGTKGLWRLFRPMNTRLVDRVAHNLGKRWADYATDPHARAAFQRVLAQSSYAAIVGRYLLPTAKTGVLDQAHSAHPVILDVDDLDTEVYRTRLRTPGLGRLSRVVIRRHLQQLERIVAELLPKFRHLWVSSRADVALIEPFNRRISVLPNVPYSMPDVPPANAPAAARVLVTVGSWTHRVNVAGVDHFIREHWPRILMSCPDARYKLIGSGMSADLKARWGRVAGVEPIGRVADLRALYAQAAAAVVPIYEGAGTKIKVLEALGFGRVPIVTPHALRGYEHVLLNRESVVVVQEDADFAAICVALLTDVGLRDALAERGRALVREHFTSEVFAREVRRTLESLCPVLIPATDRP